MPLRSQLLSSHMLELVKQGSSFLSFLMRKNKLIEVDHRVFWLHLIDVLLAESVAKINSCLERRLNSPLLKTDRRCAFNRPYIYYF